MRAQRTTFGYFFCRARQEHECDLPNLPAWQVEEAIERHYETLPLPEGFADAVVKLLDTTLADQRQLTRECRDRIAKQLAKLEARKQRLIDLAADGLLSRGKILARSNAIQTERVRLEASLADTTAELEVGAERLRQCLDLAQDPARLYAHAPDGTRQQLNATFFERCYLDDEPLGIVRDLRRPPFDEIQQAAWTYQRYRESTVGKRQGSSETAWGNVVRLEARRRPSLTAEAPEDDQTPVLADVFPVSVSSKRVMVELRGFEPLTPSMRTMGSAVQMDSGLYRLVIEDGRRLRAVRAVTPANPGACPPKSRWQRRVSLRSYAAESGLARGAIG